ncbi:cupin domain-containing protein [Sphingobium sp. HBC34]|uniref:Cupin domain-containing protein n=1 Tax=Sphingobium cyanobacteriorum TaxID=3063954 RepID=A0ABT8ZRK6_9SPHN|nr:cupin domain-containing protein [Sphingobium sp. HBC34]MDO7837179.1 cupin domain-containing protein [Sphingobium sp. HBC34]
MLINADFSRRAANHAASSEWVASPSGGVERRMLDRVGGEVARATTIVRFAPGSAFPAHSHDGGEEYFVLEGDFVDEEGSHKAGTYVRNPPGSRHAPLAPKGATIFVKLSQFAAGDVDGLSTDTRNFSGETGGKRPAIQSLQLHSLGKQNVRIEIWEPGVEIDNWGHGGIEVLVLEGGFTEGKETFVTHSWLRLPPSEPFVACAGTNGARVLIKSGHLIDAAALAFVTPT